MAFFDASTDLSGSGSEQGQLSSSYTSALTEYLQTDGADYVAFLAYLTKGLTIEDALLVKAEIEAGNFTLTDLFSAAQSKTGEVDGDDIDNPTPKLIVGDYVIDLTPMLTGTETYSWDSVTKKLTVTHTREYYTEGQEPTVDGVSYSEDWANPDKPNVAPEAVSFSKETNEWAVKDAEPVGDEALYSIDLLQGVTTDADGDAINVVSGSVSVNGTLVGDDSDLFTVDGNTLKINTNSDYFDLLFAGKTTDLTVTYQITDGVNTPVNSSGTITVTGTADQFSLTGPYSAEQTSGFNTTTWDGSLNVVIPTLDLVVGADAYFDFEGTATVTASGDLTGSTETMLVTIVDGGETITLGYTLNPDGGPFGGKEPNQDGYLGTDTDSASFASNDNVVAISYDSNTSSANGGSAGVDSLTSVSAVLTDVTYWA